MMVMGKRIRNKGIIGVRGSYRRLIVRIKKDSEKDYRVKSKTKPLITSSIIWSKTDYKFKNLSQSVRQYHHANSPPPHPTNPNKK